VIEPNSPRPLRIFLCHSSGDKKAVRELYHRLRNDGFDPWLDEEKLKPGQQWEREIPRAVRNSDVVIVCLSHSSITKIGFVQKEIKFALDVADLQPEDTIFLIPVKLEECNVPERLSQWQWVNLYEEHGYNRLLVSLRQRSSEYALTDTRPEPDIAELSRNSEKEYFEIALNCAKNRNYDGSIENFTKAIQLNPNNAEYYYDRGVAYFEKFAFDQAIKDFTKAIELNSDYTNAYFNRGIIYDRKGDYDEAIKNFTKVIELEPDKAKAYLNRGAIYGSKKDPDKAIIDFSRAIELEPNFLDNYINRGIAFANKGDFDKAITDFREALSIDPNNPYAKEYLAMALREKKSK
jgi:tetratricopeptide (TPR) repeat protein